MIFKRLEQKVERLGKNLEDAKKELKEKKAEVWNKKFKYAVYKRYIGSEPNKLLYHNSEDVGSFPAAKKMADEATNKHDKSKYGYFIIVREWRDVYKPK